MHVGSLRKLWDPITTTCKSLNNEYLKTEPYLLKCLILILQNIKFAIKESNLHETYFKINGYFKNIDNYMPVHIDDSVADFEIPDDKKALYLFFILAHAFYQAQNNFFYIASLLWHKEDTTGPRKEVRKSWIIIFP